MATIGKVKSEYTLTGPKANRTDTPAKPSTPKNTQIPKAKSSTSPQTAFNRKSFLARRKLAIGDAKASLTRSSPSEKVHNIIYFDACTCDPELLGSANNHPNCTFMNICNEHMRGAYRWREYLWTFVGYIAQFLLAPAIVMLAFYSALHGLFWLFGGKYRQVDHEAEANTLYDMEEDEPEQLDQELVLLNPKDFSVTEVRHARGLLDFVYMTIAILFGWIDDALLSW